MLILFVIITEMISVLQSTISDIDLLREVKDGSQQAFSLIVERYQKLVAKTVFGMLGNTPESDDVGQEVFIRFYNSLDSFRGESSLGTYLTRIAINLSINELKKRKRKALFYFQNDGENYREMDVADDLNQDEIRETNELVEKALAAIDPKFRAVVVLRLIQGYSTKETSEILNLPQGTVLSRLARAQDKLKNVLQILMR
jgi:RNA polymerase sigma-70 factor (ECF subfamily)